MIIHSRKRMNNDSSRGRLQSTTAAWDNGRPDPPYTQNALEGDEMQTTQGDPYPDFPVAPYSCGHLPEGICDGCLEARLKVRQAIDARIALDESPTVFGYLPCEHDS